jgi:hypothetical protein
MDPVDPSVKAIVFMVSVPVPEIVPLIVIVWVAPAVSDGFDPNGIVVPLEQVNPMAPENVNRLNVMFGQLIVWDPEEALSLIVPPFALNVGDPV